MAAGSPERRRRGTPGPARTGGRSRGRRCRPRSAPPRDRAGRSGPAPARARAVGPPRPSRARRASPRARTPSHEPPGAKSPDSSARDGNRSIDAVGPAAHAVETRAADHGHAPPRSGPGPEHGQGVVVEEVARCSTPAPDGAGEPLLVHREVHAGQAVHPGGRSRAGLRVEAGGWPERTRWWLRARPWPRRSRRTGGWIRRPGPAPRRAPSASTTQTSVFDAPPSTARTSRPGGRPVARPRLNRSRRRSRITGDVTFDSVGTKVAVVGGGSTYTPELVDSLCAHEDRLVVDELVLLDPDADRLEAVGGLAERILRGRGWAGHLVTTDQRDRAIDGADFVVVQLRVGGQAARHTDETLPIGYGCLGQETTGPGGLAKALRTVPLVLEIAEETAAPGRAGRLGGRLHQPGRDRDPGPGRRGPPGGGPVQRGHPRPAPDRPLPRGRSRHRRARARRAQPSDLGPIGGGRRGGPTARAARPLRPRARAGERRPRRASPPARGAALLLPALLLLPRPEPGRAVRPRLAVPGRGGGRARGRAAGRVPGPGPRHQAEKALLPGRRLLLGGGGAADGLAPRRHRRHPGGRRPQRRRRARPARRRGGRGPLHGRTATAPIRCPSGPCPPTCRVWSPTARRTSAWRSRRRCRGAGRP